LKHASGYYNLGDFPNGDAKNALERLTNPTYMPVAQAGSKGKGNTKSEAKAAKAAKAKAKAERKATRKAKSKARAEAKANKKSKKQKH
jgi:hypothetical protein